MSYHDARWTEEIRSTDPCRQAAAVGLEWIICCITAKMKMALGKTGLTFIELAEDMQWQHLGRTQQIELELR